MNFAYNNINKTNNKIESISILRVLGMFSIVFCHIAGYLNIAFLASFLNFGIYLFLFISGFLYANKTIANYKKWYFDRMKKIIIPFYLFIIPVMILYYSNNSLNVLEIVKYLFCLQGVNFLTNILPFSEIEPLGNLWFVTIIMLCYLLLIPIKKLESKYVSSKKMVIACLVLAFFVPKIFGFFNIPYIVLDYFVFFFLGYYVSKFKVNVDTIKFIFFGLILFLFSIIFRLSGKALFDDNHQMIYQFIVSITQPLSAISCFFIVDFITKKTIFIKTIANSRFWSVLDKYSYYIYITHYAFLNSVTSVVNFGYSVPISMFLFIIITILSSIIVFKLSKLIEKIIIRG